MNDKVAKLVWLIRHEAEHVRHGGSVASNLTEVVRGIVETPEEAVNRLTEEWEASPASKLPWVPPADESGYVEVPELSASLRNEALLEIYSKIPAPMGYEILAEKADYRLVADPEQRWHVQCISTGAWYTEASSGLVDDSQTRSQYLALVAEHFPDYVDDEEDDNADR
jgi:hypothetical protein